MNCCIFRPNGTAFYLGRSEILGIADRSSRFGGMCCKHRYYCIGGCADFLI